MNKLLKSCLYYLLASLIVVLCAHYIHLALVYLDMFFVYVNILISPIFNQVGLGKIVHKTFVLLLIPIVVIGIPALIYKLIKHQTMPYFFQLIWGIWLVLVLSTIMIH